MNTESPQARMRRYIQMVATGPELSKSLDRDQARDGVALILRGEVDAVRAGADAVLAASIFHDGEWSIADLKAELASSGLEVRS